METHRCGVRLMALTREPLGEHVGNLVASRDVLEVDGAVIVLLMEEVVLDIDVLCACVRGLVLGEHDGRLIVDVQNRRG